MRFACLLVLWMGVTTATAQEINFWHILAEVGFKKTKIAYGEMETPVFSNHLKSYQGKKIKLKGFVIPVSETGDESKFMLSALPLMFVTFVALPGLKLLWRLKPTKK